MLVDPDRAFSDPDGVVEIIQNAVIQHDPDSPDILNLKSDQNQYFDVEETSALYAQANFETGIFRGNVGFRYIETDVDSIGFGPEKMGMVFVAYSLRREAMTSYYLASTWRPSYLKI